jgi:hypothetical protein
MASAAEGRVQYRFRLPLADEEALRLFLETAFGVKIPDVAVCPGHVSPWRAVTDAYFARQRVMVCKASRGFGGKSFLLAMLGLTEALTLKADVNILGGSGEQSRRVLGYMTRSWGYPSAPRHRLASDPLKRETRLTWGNSVQALMASQTSVRGPHVPRLRLDEVDEMEYAIFTAALGQTMSKGGVAAQTVISSTHHHPKGTMTEVLKLAAEKDWPVYEWCYRESLEPHGWLSAAELDAKRRDVPAAMFQVEYDLQEPSPEGRAMMPEAVAAMFDSRLGTFEGREGAYLEIEPPQPGASYKHGADWARSVDWTVIVTIRTDVTPARLVAFERLGRRPWPQMVGRFEARLQRYGGVACHDATGLGDVVDGYLTQPAAGIILVGRTRADLFSNYISTVEQGGLVAPMIRFLHAEHAYATIDDLYGARHPPDGFVAMALAWHARTLKRNSRWLPVDDTPTAAALNHGAAS